MTGIEKIFSGYTRLLEWTKGISGGEDGYGMIKPPPQKAWIVLGGHISHVTGTISTFNVVEKYGAAGASQVRWMIKAIAAASASRNYPLFEIRTDLDVTTNSRVGDQAAAWTPYIITPDLALYFDGAATAEARVQVLEFDYK